MEDKCKTGRVTIPTDLDVVPETLEILKKWGADAIRDCDGTDFPQELKNAFFSSCGKSVPSQSRMASAPHFFRISNVSGTTSRSVGMVTRPVLHLSSIVFLSYPQS